MRESHCSGISAQSYSLEQFHGPVAEKGASESEARSTSGTCGFHEAQLFRDDSDVVSLRHLDDELEWAL